MALITCVSLLSALRGRMSGSSGAQLLHVADLRLMLLSALRRFAKWIQRSADHVENVWMRPTTQLHRHRFGRHHECFVTVRDKEHSL